MRSGRACKATQRSAWASSRSSMVAKWRLTSTELVSGHRCSAGWSSGEYGGRKRRCTWSGTRRRTLACQPARSKTSTICLVGLAPTCCAKAASSTSKRGMLTVVAKWKTVRPEAGWTKPTRERQSYSRSDVALARWDVGRRNTRPCAGSACGRSGARRPPRVRSEPAGKPLRPPAAAASRFFAQLLLPPVRQDVAGTRFAALAVQAHQVRPAQVHAHRPAQLLAHPGRDRPAQPVIALRRGSADRLGELRELLGRQERRGAMRVGVLPVDHPGWPLRVVPFGNLATPIGRIARAHGNRPRRLPFGQ